MYYTDLIEKLQEDYEISPSMTAECPQIHDVRSIGKDIKQWDAETLYIGCFGFISEKPDLPVMLLTVDDPGSLPEGSCCSRIRTEDSETILLKARDLVFEDVKADADLFKLVQAALRKKSVIHLINKAATLLGNTLILVDSGTKILAYSSVHEVMDPLWAENIKRGYYSHEFIQQVRSSKQMQEWHKNDKSTHVITLPGDLQPKLVARITYKEHIIGSVVMIAHHRPINRQHHRQLPIVGQVLFNRMNQDVSEGLRKPLHSTILYNLLDEKKIPDTLELMDISKADFPETMQVIVSRFLHPIQNRFLKRSINLELERIFPHGYSVQYKSYIAIVVPAISEEQTEELNRLVESEDINIGISWQFSNILMFGDYFHQAVSSIKQAQSFSLENKIFNYTDFAFYDLLYSYIGKIPLEQYCNPAISLLKDYDRKKNTEFYTTLRVYLEHNRNLNTTAEALFLHRNSLIYRIKRIKELIELDFNNINVVNSLIDSFRIDNFLDSIKKNMP